ILENRLDVLLGQVPDGRSRVRALALKESAVPLPIIGVPASLLNNRPDLRVARAELIAADADIGIAIANRLPGLTLSGFGGYSDGSSYNGQLGSLSLDLIQPLLDWGRRKAEVSYNKALYQEQLAAFSLAWLEALAEVEDGLLQEHKQRQHLQLLEQRREVLQETLEESEARFTQGVDNYLPVLNTLTSLRALERNLVDQRLALFNLRIQLYGAIGGVIPSTAIPSTTIENSPATGNFDLSASSSTASPTPFLTCLAPYPPQPPPQPPPPSPSPSRLYSSDCSP
ncbi:MAG: TolC family protein, partial [Oceanobacter sp.]